MELDAYTGGQTDGQTDDVPHEDSDAEEDVLDPRIQRELDHLNLASTDINRLENELDEARSKYRSTVSGISNQMESVARDRKKSIHKAREFYKLTGEARAAQAEALKAVRQFQTATSVYKAAKETLALAECKLTENTTTAQLTSAWQEMLNHAITNVTNAEKEKTKCESEHKRRANRFAELETKIQALEKKYTRSIKKARPYFELKAELDIKLIQQKQNVNDLLAAIKASKKKYTESLRELEKISEEIHQSRKDKFWSKIPRMPGVGAETDSACSSLSEMAIDSANVSLCNSAVSLYEEDHDESIDEGADIRNDAVDGISAHIDPDLDFPLPEETTANCKVTDKTHTQPTLDRKSSEPDIVNNGLGNDKILSGKPDLDEPNPNPMHILRSTCENSDIGAKVSDESDKCSCLTVENGAPDTGSIKQTDSSSIIHRDSKEQKEVVAEDTSELGSSTGECCDKRSMISEDTVSPERELSFNQYEETSMAIVNMASVERPSLSGEEES